MSASVTKRLAILAGFALAFAGAAIAAPSGSPAAGPSEWTGDLAPIQAADWNYARAAHLLERAGFSGTPAEIEKLAAMTPEQAVDSLINYETIDASHLPPFIESGIWSSEMLPDIDAHIEFGEGIAKANRTGDAYGAKPLEGGVRPMQPVINMLYYRNYATRLEWNRAVVWWGNRMVATPRPLEEKLTLFWHGHFATEQEKVRDYRLLLKQLDMLRANASGNFRNLLIGIGQDPAMLIYLDNRKNIKGHANENFAREIMELFALGVGNYTEDDIKEAARAFTGWTNVGPEFMIKPELHDAGEKTVLGKTGNFDGEDVVDILLEQKVCAEFISAKLYRFFVREDLSAELNAKLAASLRASNYEFKPLLRAIFLSKDFYSPASCGTHIKSPTEFLVSTYRKLGLTEIPGTPQFNVAAARLGQDLGNPPNVAGWDGGRSWLNPSTLLERGNMMRHLLFPAEAGDAYFVGPFTGRYLRYQYAPMEVAKRDREAELGIAGPAAYETEGAMMMAGGGKVTGGNMKGDESMMSEGMMAAPASKMINSNPAYDLQFGVYNGMNRAYETVMPIPTTPAQIDLIAMLREAGAATVDDAIDYLERRFLLLSISASDRAAMKAFMVGRNGGEALHLERPNAERDLRELLHLIMSTPEFQIG